MKKKLTILAAGASLLLVSCSSGTAAPASAVSTAQAAPASSVAAAPSEPSAPPKQTSVQTTVTNADSLETAVEQDVENTLSDLAQKREQLLSQVSTYEAYIANADAIEAYYADLTDSTEQLCIRLREYSLSYAQAVVRSEPEKAYDELDSIYDVVYDDAGDDLYDEIYDGILDDLYDDFYDGILDDAYDTAPYKEWSDARSTEYDLWSDCRSDVYSIISDFRSDTYEFCSDVRTQMWDEDVERAEKKMAKFQEKIEKLKQ